MNLILFILSTLSLASVVVLTPKNIDSIIDGSKHVLVKFYAPMAPTYEQLAENFAKEKDIVIAEADCDAHKELATKYKIEGFPTMKYFAKGSTTAEDYSAGRDLENFVDYLNNKAGSRVVIKKPETFVTVLTDSSFDKEVLQSKKNTLVEFYAPWCGHCKNLAPIYEKVAKVFKNEESCVVANVDATVSEESASRYNVQGYPTLKFFSASGEVKDYNGGRTLEDLVDFLNENCKTFRGYDGQLNEKAGRTKEFDELAAAFNNDASVLEKAKDKAKSKNEKYYVKAMEKIIKKKDYLEKEIARLTKIIDGGNTSAEKQDDFVTRRNILNAFKEVSEEL
ncbi:Protein disulfide-isomerase-like 2-2 [Boothiomyces sp. JEL0838]|nr:Protein disulfide-isomerase-like 2-2 [Boothiomyces sp. JEL0838]KAJ3313506.1 Protein disulfide-isomerase-like 2-2 [Boothiomyces sp. JEL0838]